MTQTVFRLLHRIGVGRLLSRQLNAPPLLFFLIITLSKFGYLSIQAFSTSLFFIGWIFVFFEGYSHLHYCTPIAGSSISLGWIGAVLAGLWANQVWKIYLSVFLLMFSLTSFDEDLQNVGLVIMSGFILYKTHHEMIFPTWADNKFYFTGFFVFGFISLFDLIAHQSLKMEFMAHSKLFLIPFLIWLGSSLIKFRSARLIELKATSRQDCLIKNAGVLEHHIEVVWERISTTAGLVSYLNEHVEKCFNSSCYCRMNNQVDSKWLESSRQKAELLKKQIIDNIYQSYIYEDPSSGAKLYSYLLFLVESDQFSRAMRLLVEMRSSQAGYFSILSQLKIRECIFEKLSHEGYFDPNSPKYDNIYEYDYNMGYINKEIREILIQKVCFWREICREYSRVAELETMGRALVIRIETLHKFYMLKMRSCEEALSNFNSSIIYAAYLITTTNYLEFANSLLKRNQKSLDGQKGIDMKMGSCYGLRLKILKNMNRQKQTKYDLTINNISSSLAALLKQEKKNLLNENVAKIIPEEFANMHSWAFSDYMRDDSLRTKRSQFFTDTIELPFKVTDQEVRFLNLTSRLYLDFIAEEPCVQCILSLPASDSINFIMSIEGKIQYFDNSGSHELVQDPQIAQKLNTAREDWEKRGHISSVREKIEIDDSNYTVEVEGMFLGRAKLLGRDPVLRLKIENQIFRKEACTMDKLEINERVKEMQKMEVRNDNDSEASEASTKDSIENILNLLSDSNSFRMEESLTVILIILLVCIMAGFLALDLTLNIWENQDFTKSSSLNVGSYILIRSYFNKAGSWKNDERDYIKLIMSSDTEAVDLTNTLYPVQGFPMTARLSQGYFFYMERTLLNSFMIGMDSAITPYTENYLMKTVKVRDPNLIPEDGSVLEQTMSLQSLMVNFIVDTYTFVLGATYRSTVLSYEYLSVVYPLFGSLIEQSSRIMRKNILALERNNIILVCFLSALLVLLLLPYGKFVRSNKARHENIFNVLVSLDSKLVIDQISKLKKVEREVFFYRHSLDSNERRNSTVCNTFRSNGSIQVAKPEADKPKNKRESKDTDNKQRDSGIDFGMLMQGFKKMAAEEIIEVCKNGETIKLRKRVGDLDVRGSECDPKRCVWSDWVVAVFILIFIGLFAGVFFFKIKLINGVQQNFEEMTEDFSRAESRSIILYNTKVFINEYTLDNRVQFLGEDLEKWILRQIRGYETSSSPNFIQIKECAQNLLVCRQSYSKALLESMIIKTVVDAFEMKRSQLYEGANETEIDQISGKIRFQLFFAQQIDDMIQREMIAEFVEGFYVFAEREKVILSNKSKVRALFWVLVVLFCLFMAGYIRWMKGKYVREVTMLSFLSKEMLFGNKRIESFVRKLSRSFR